MFWVEIFDRAGVRRARSTVKQFFAFSIDPVKILEFTAMASNVFAEDKMGQKIDRCFSDSLIKAGQSFAPNALSVLHKFDKISRSNEIFIILSIFPGVGLSLGGVFSLLFFKRRMWPLYGGTFFGLGVAYNNCEKALNGK